MIMDTIIKPLHLGVSKVIASCIFIIKRDERVSSWDIGEENKMESVMNSFQLWPWAEQQQIK